MDPYICFHQNQSKNDKVMGVFKIGANFDSPSEDEPPYVFLFKSVKKDKDISIFIKKN